MTKYRHITSQLSTRCVCETRTNCSGIKLGYRCRCLSRKLKHSQLVRLPENFKFGHFPSLFWRTAKKCSKCEMHVHSVRTYWFFGLRLFVAVVLALSLYYLKWNVLHYPCGLILPHSFVRTCERVVRTTNEHPQVSFRDRPVLKEKKIVKVVR